MVLLGTYLWTAFVASMHTDHSRRLLQVVWALRNTTGERKKRHKRIKPKPACIHARVHPTGLEGKSHH